MYKLVLILGIQLTSITSYSQDSGIKIGTLMSRVVDYVPGAILGNGYSINGIYRGKLDEYFNFQIEPGYITNGFETVSDLSHAKYRFKFFESPLLLALHPLKKKFVIQIHVGLAPKILLSAKVDRTFSDNTIYPKKQSSELQEGKLSIDYLLGVGLGYKVNRLTFLILARHNRGITKVVNPGNFRLAYVSLNAMVSIKMKDIQ